MKRKLPENKADYKEIIDLNCVYVDKTKYIEILEKDLIATDFMFLRPRRFGKSLFLSILFYYYDINSKHLFDKLFGVGNNAHTYIGKNPTNQANSFYVIRFDFSKVDASDKDNLQFSFNEAVRMGIMDFQNHYQLNIEEEYTDSAATTLGLFLVRAKGKIGKKLIILIDEYDHFTNDILSDKDFFINITGKDGFVRAFYATIKSDRQTGCIAKIFATGVSAITLDSMTSGANNIVNYSTHPVLNEMLGFTKKEVIGLIDEFSLDSNIIDELELNYNGYLFSETGIGERVFNSNLVNMYLKKYIETRRAPLTIKGSNILTDANKISSMLDLYEIEEIKEKIITDILANQKVNARYVDEFKLGSKLNRDQFIHLLFYLGILTIESTDKYGIEFRIPNVVTKEIFDESLKEYLDKKYDLDDLFYDRTRNAIQTFIETEDLSELNNVFESKFMMPFQTFSHFNERTIQIAYYSSLIEYQKIEIRIEDTVNKGVADLILIHNNRIDILEFKYISKSKYTDADFNDLRSDGIDKLNKYAKKYEYQNKKINKHLIIYVSGECREYQKI